MESLLFVLSTVVIVIGGGGLGWKEEKEDSFVVMGDA